MKGNKLTRSFHSVGFKIKKHSPEILIVAGITGVVTSTVMACKATTKLSKVLEESKENIDQLHDYVETKGYSEKYTEDDYKKDLVLVYFQSGLKVAKLYAPAVGLGVLSISAIVMSNRILTKRNVALAAAYATVDKSFKNYRERVVERFGEEMDYKLRHGIKEDEVEVTTVDENGKEVKTKEKVYSIDPSNISEYARFFQEWTHDDKGNSVKNDYWQPNNEYNLMFLKRCEAYANDRLRVKKTVFLNEVYDMLGLPRTQAGQIVGWVYDENNDDGDNYIDFGLYKDPTKYTTYVDGYDSCILLDFNVQGNVWNMM